MQSVAEAPASGRYTASDFLAANRGGGLFSETVNQPIGAVFALIAYRLNLAPTVLTIANLLLGLGASATVAALAPTVADGDIPAWVVGLGALVAWQLAYSMDCADGQLARVTRRTSPAGARVDVLCDVAVQISLVAVLSATAVAQEPDTPAWLVAVFAGTWMVNLITSVMQSGPQAASMITSRSLPVRVIKLVRDYGAVLAFSGLILAFFPQWTVWVLVAFATINGLFLLASIAHSARASLKQP